MNPLITRSPGPIYNTAGDLKKMHAYKFGTFSKFKSPKKLDVDFVHPDISKFVSTSLKTHFTLTNHRSNSS